MKRLLLAAALAVLAPLTVAAQTPSRDVLLTSNGELYTIESVFTEDVEGLDAAATSVLQLRVDGGEQLQSMIVPASTSAGVSGSPALAYDSASKTLFVFWEHRRNNGLATDLLFASYHDGAWSPAATITGADLHVCSNLRVLATRSGGQLTVHTTWWEDSGRSESAKYAMLTIQNGAVANIAVRDLEELARDVRVDGGQPSSDDLLRHPILLAGASSDEVDAIFGSTNDGALRRISIRIVEDGFIRIPGGIRGGPIGHPSVRVGSTSRPDAIALPGSGHIAFYVTTGDRIDYATFDGTSWSATHALPLGARLTQEAAVNALRRMLANE